ncbi:MAG: hypothetical protein ACHP79_11035, partial [Terriglobales bacterium]
MRLIITFCCFAVLGPLGRADTIVLKNGDRIVVDSVRESNGRVTYFIGDNTFTIPKSIVVRIEAGPGVTPAVEPPRAVSEEISPVHQQMTGADELTARVIRNNQVDTAALKAIEDQGVAQQSAVANSIAA